MFVQLYLPSEVTFIQVISSEFISAHGLMGQCEHSPAPQSFYSYFELTEVSNFY